MIVEIEGVSVEMHEDDWREYQDHLEQAESWREFLAKLVRDKKANNREEA